MPTEPPTVCVPTRVLDVSVEPTVEPWISSQRVALAAVAVLAVVLAIPAGMMFKSGGGGEPELSGVSDADLEAARVKACKDKVAKEAEQAKASKTAAPAAPKAADGSKPKDPCDPAELKVTAQRRSKGTRGAAALLTMRVLVLRNQIDS